MTNLEMFGKRLKKLRRLKKLSQEALAEKSGISPKYLSKIELGKHFPSIDIIATFAKHLNVELEEMFQFSNEEKTTKALEKQIHLALKETDREKLLSTLRILTELKKFP